MLKVTLQPDESSGLCPVRDVLSGVTGKWQSLILLSLEDGAQRFSSVKRLIGDISQRVLTQNLRSLERDGFILRHVVTTSPIEVRYELTALGCDAVDLLKPLVIWAEQHHKGIKRNRAKFDEAD